jgi:hypothetical protein
VRARSGGQCADRRWFLQGMAGLGLPRMPTAVGLGLAGASRCPAGPAAAGRTVAGPAGLSDSGSSRSSTPSRTGRPA